MKIKDLKELMKNFNDEDEVLFEDSKERLHNINGYDDEWYRKQGKPKLIIYDDSSRII